MRIGRCAEQERDRRHREPAAELPVRVVQLRQRRTGGRRIAHIVHDSDNGRLPLDVLIADSHRHPRADRRVIQVPPCERAVDDHDGRRRLGVQVIEVAAVENPDAQRAKRASADEPRRRLHGHDAVRALEGKRARRSSRRHRQLRRERDVCRRRRRSEPIEDAANEQVAPFRRVHRSGQRHARRQDSRWVESAIGVQQREKTATQQQRPDEQHARDRDLPGHDRCSRAAHAGCPAGSNRRRGVLGERGHEVQAADLEGGQKAEGDTRADRNDERKHGHRDIQRHVGDPWEVRWKNGGNDLVKKPGEEQSGAAAHQPEQQALGEELANHARGTCAEGRSNRHLPPACRGTGKMKARDIGRRRQEQQNHGGQHDGERLPDVCRHRFLQRRRGYRHRTVATEDRGCRHAGVGRELASRGPLCGCLRSGGTGA